ncbi:hypothetical protein D3C87_1037930 [compost metagenome]
MDGSRADRRVSELMGRPYAVVDEAESLSKVSDALLKGDGAVLVAKHGKPSGVLTKIDLIEFFAGAQSLKAGV